MLCVSCVHAARLNDNSTLDQVAVNSFISNMTETHNFEPAVLEQMFSQADYLQSVIDAITRPAEKMPWYRYKKIFLTEDRVQGGVKYWHEHADTLAAAEKEFGVPAEIIVAIIGVETRYGAHTGNYRVIDSLATLAFHYPKRADFFRSELEQFLLLAREQEVDPLTVKGSYAGAMGIPQFISSSYRNFAVDFDNNNQVNLWDNHVDAIGSVANYFKRHNWQRGQPAIYPVERMPEDYDQLERSQLKPETPYTQWQQAGVRSATDIAPQTPVALLEFEEVDGPSFWLGLHNFYVITRYNHSQLYALAVYQLAQDIRNSYKAEN